MQSAAGFVISDKKGIDMINMLSCLFYIKNQQMVKQFIVVAVYSMQSIAPRCCGWHIYLLSWDFQGQLFDW